MLGTPSILYVGFLYVLFSPPNIWPHLALRRPPIHEQFTYGVVSEGLFAESLRNSANLHFFFRKGFRNSVESLRKFAENVLQ